MPCGPVFANFYSLAAWLGLPSFWSCSTASSFRSLQFCPDRSLGLFVRIVDCGLTSSPKSIRASLL